MYLNYESLPVYGSYDAVVIGGGVAGVGAAIALGKRGVRTLIIEATSALGGLTTMGLVNIPLDFVSGIGKEMLSELDKVQGHWHRNTDPEKHKLVLDRMIRKYGIDVLFVTSVIDTITEGRTVKGVVITSKTGAKVVWGKTFLDCSGDSDAAFYAGCETVCGRRKDGMSQACSMEFTLAGVDWDKYVTSDLKKNDSRWIETIQKALDSGDLPFEVDNHLNWITHLPGRPEHCGKDEVSICFAHSRRCFPTDNRDLTRMYFEGREQADFLSKFIKKFIPGFENSYLSATGSLLGVRESRRVIGGYVLTASDIAHLRKFDDVIAISTHGYDIHNYEAPGNVKWAPVEVNGEIQYVICNPGGFGTTTPPPDGKRVVNVKGQTAETAEFEPNGYYDIPYRCLVAKDVDNLLMAGRNISTDVEAQSGIRLIMCCTTMGEAAGTAAAMSLAKGILPRELDYRELQRELVRSGVNIGQKFRSIPALQSPAAEEEDEYANPELYTPAAGWAKAEEKTADGKGISIISMDNEAETTGAAASFSREEQYTKVRKNEKF